MNYTSLSIVHKSPFFSYPRPLRVTLKYLSKCPVLGLNLIESSPFKGSIVHAFRPIRGCSGYLLRSLSGTILDGFNKKTPFI